MTKKEGSYSTKTKTLMVETAIKLFKDKGVSNVSVQDICFSCNVTRNCFYYYFQSKELLFDSIGDYISEYSKQKFLKETKATSFYHQIWQYYKVFLETELEVGPDIMNHCCVSRTAKGFADKYSYVDENMANTLKDIIKKAKQAQEITSSASEEDLVWISYAVIRGANIKWCFQWGESNLLWDAARGLDTLFLPTEKYKILRNKEFKIEV